MVRKKLANVVRLILILLVGAGSFFLFRVERTARDEKGYGEVFGDVAALPEADSGEANGTARETTQETLPQKVLIKVPFLVQAPLANWDALHEDACEEASLIMYYHFIQKTEIGSAEEGDKEIKDLIDYEEKNGYGPSITVLELSKIGADHYGLNGRVVSNVTTNKIKEEIAAGRPVILPAAGKILPNPNFRNGGPNYHMLLVIGYDDTEFITNDPGTRKGQYFRYKYDDLINANHNWDSVDILKGEKSILVFDQ
jgi:hypothetical protein